MPTAKAGYFTSKGERVPGTTTVIGRFKNSGGLIHWAWELGYKPYRESRAMIERIVKQGAVDSGTLHDCKLVLETPADSFDYRNARDAAASIGTIVHARVDAYAKKTPFDPAPYVSAEFPDPVAASDVGYGAFLEWAGTTSFELGEGEIQLVSEKYRYGGCPDVILIRGEKTVGDYKTGDIYAEQVLPQLAAYENLLIECGKVGGGKGVHAMSINKKTGGFVHRFFTPDEVSRGWKAFTMMRELYDLVKELK